MKKLGYIVSKRKLKNVVDFVGVVNSIEDIEDPTKPFLIIGLNEAKEITPNFSILNKKLDEDVFWNPSGYDPTKFCPDGVHPNNPDAGQAIADIYISELNGIIGSVNN